MANRKQRELSKSSFQINSLYVKIFIASASIFIIFYLLYFNSQNKGKTVQESIKNEQTDKAKNNQEAVKVEPIKERVRLPQIEILNGCGISSITGLFRPFFKKHNVDVISTGNFKDFKQQKSFIIVHSEIHKKKVEKLAEELGIKEKQIKYEIEANPLQEFTLVLGADFTKLHYK